MANITRYDPFGDLGDFFKDDFFKGFFFKPVRLPEAQSVAQIRMDVTEDDKAYTVRAELPGVKKEDIKISLDGNQVTISAEVKQEKEEKKGEKVICKERYHGSVYRSFSLASDVDEAQASAKHADGVLEVVLPKKAGGAVKQIAIQ